MSEDRSDQTTSIATFIATFFKSEISNSSLSKLNSFRRSSLYSAIAFSAVMASGPVHAQQDTPEVEEVVVTGSFIRRSEGFTAASPITVLGAEDLDAQGTANLAQVVQNMTFNNGTSVTNSIQGATDISPAFNLRGLGTRATLQLVDGKRTTTDNVNALLPDIAIQRIDIVTDGAAALYGTDAVAGVVNLIPYSNFEGLDMEVYHEGDDRGDYKESQVGILAGTALSPNVHVVAAAGMRQQGRLRWMDRPSLMTSGLTHNGGGNPGNFLAPVRDENGDITGMSAQPDPTCGLIEEDPVKLGANPYGLLFAGRCWLDFGDTRDLRTEQDLSQFYTSLEYDPSEDFTFKAEAMYSRRLIESRNNPGNPGGRAQDLPVVRGELPGNTFRAVTSTGAELFAQPLLDDMGNIVRDGHGRPLPMRGADGQVVLAQNRFASMSQDPLGGVPFYEDVQFIDGNVWLPFGKTNTKPTGFLGDGTNPQLYDNRNMRIALTADFRVPYVEGWEGMASYTYSTYTDRRHDNQVFSYQAIYDGISCDVINDVDSCFNPFGLVDPRFANSQEVVDDIWTNYRRRDEDQLQTFDLIFNGTIPTGDFQLPGGDIGAAIGYQRREEKMRDLPSAGFLTGDQFIGAKKDVNYGSRAVDAVFGEFLLPVLDNLEVNGAVRYEGYSTDQSDTIAKIGMVYEPMDWLGIRATWGQAFIAPTIRQLQANESCGLTNANDPFTGIQAWVTSCNSGNPDLVSETSESISASIDLIPMDNLTLSLTWSETDFKDRIVSTTTEDILRSDFADFQAAYGWSPSGGETLPPRALVEQWVNDPRSDPRISRLPGNVEAIQRIQQSDANASTMLVRAWDTQMSYMHPTQDWGNFLFNVQATYMDTYRFQEFEDSPVREAAGNQNNPFGAVPAIPRWRANARLGWSYGNHTFSTTVRYVHSVRFDASDFSFQQFFPFNTWRHVDEVRPWTQADMYYTYEGLEVPGNNGELSLTLGSRNVFDREAQKTGMISGVVAELQDPLGRVIYGRVNYSF